MDISNHKFVTDLLGGKKAIDKVRRAAMAEVRRTKLQSIRDKREVEDILDELDEERQEESSRELSSRPRFYGSSSAEIIQTRLS